MTDWHRFLSGVDARIKALRATSCSDPYFRGHADGNWRLEPGLARVQRTNTRFNPNKEERLYWSFRMRGSHFLPPNASQWTILYYMQHYGIPTRLLDWSTNFAAALHFALANNAPSPCVWILDPYELNDKVLGSRSVSNMNVSFDMDYVSFMKLQNKPFGALAADGDSSIERIRSQGGAFTIHGNLTVPIEEHAVSAVSRHDIPQAAIPEAMAFLELAGVNEFSIFPDLAGLARLINKIELGVEN